MESNIIEITKIKTINFIEVNDKPIEKIVGTEDIINYISSSLLSVIQNNKKMKLKPSKGPNEPLYSKMIPVLPLKKFLLRIIKYTEAENNTLIVAYLYIIKLIKAENFILSLNNIYRILLGSVVLAKKFLEDINFNNLYFCQIGGMTVQELNSVEFSLFVRINFDANPKIEEVNDIYKNIIYSLASSKKKEYSNIADNL